MNPAEAEMQDVPDRMRAMALERTGASLTRRLGAVWVGESIARPIAAGSSSTPGFT